MFTIEAHWSSVIAFSGKCKCIMNGCSLRFEFKHQMCGGDEIRIGCVFAAQMRGIHGDGLDGKRCVIVNHRFTLNRILYWMV